MLGKSGFFQGYHIESKDSQYLSLNVKQLVNTENSFRLQLGTVRSLFEIGRKTRLFIFGIVIMVVIFTD